MNDTDLTALVGLSESEARRRVEAAGWRFRVLEIDGVGQASTADLRDDRVNVSLMAGTVTDADVG